jgi:hypothetical protein
MFMKILSPIGDVFGDLFSACGTILLSLITICIVLSVFLLALVFIPTMLLGGIIYGYYEKHFKSDSSDDI